MDIATMDAFKAVPDYSDTEILKIRYAQIKAQCDDLAFENAFLHERVNALKEEIASMRRGNLRVIK